MKLDEAQVIYKSWQQFMEIADKYDRLFCVGLPESFLPYPRETLDKALDVVTKHLHDIGDERQLEDLNLTITRYLMEAKKDNEAIEDLSNMLDMFKKSPDLKETCLQKSAEGQEIWLNIRNSRR